MTGVDAKVKVDSDAGNVDILVIAVMSVDI